MSDRARMIGHVWYSALVGWINGWSTMARVYDELAVSVRLLLPDELVERRSSAIRLSLPSEPDRPAGSLASAPEHDPRPARQPLFRRRPVHPDGHPVDQRVRHPHGRVRGQALAVGREVADPAQRPGRHRRRVEDAQVGRLAHLDACPGRRARRRRPARPSACGWPARAA